MSDAAWLSALMRDGEVADLPRLIAQAEPDVRFVADDTSYAILEAALHKEGLPTDVLVHRRFFAIKLMLNFDIRRVVVVDAADEETARAELLAELKRLQTPEPILATMQVHTFVADYLASYAARATGVADFPDVAKAFPAHLYAIVSTPRAGSTFLSSLMSSVGLGAPFEHLRPWLARLFADRPVGLFNAIRLFQNIICLGARGDSFGTKLISHLIDDLVVTLTPAEASYLKELMARTRIIYLFREDKLDQAISSIRAHRTGIWHVTDPGARRILEPAELNVDVSEVEREIADLQQAERALASQILGGRAVLPVSYAELCRDPAAVAGAVAAFLGHTIEDLPRSEYIVLADAASNAVREAYLAHIGGDPSKVVMSAQAALAAARDDAERLEADNRRRAAAIREGHATSKAGDYQDRHFYLLDYKSTHIPGLVFPCRGPVPTDVDAGGYMAFVGAAQTFGAFVAHPFPEQVGQAFGREVLNLGRGGGGPTFFTALPRVMELLGKASALVVQVMASRMISNSRFTSIEGRAAVRYREDDGSETVMDCDQAWTRALQTMSHAEVLALVDESRRNWVEGMKQLAAVAQGPKILFYFGMRQPDYEIAFRDVWSLYGEYPQMVLPWMIEEVRPHYDRFVEVISTAGLPETMRSVFSGELLPAVFGGGKLEEQTVETQNIYYPSQAMNDQAAAALIGALEPLMSR